MPTSGFLLEGLTPDTRAELLTELRRRRFAKGEVIFHEGDPGDTLHLIERGHVAIRTSTPLGDVLTLTVLGPGDGFGEQALLSADARRTASAVALGPAETRSLSRDRFEHLRRSAPSVDRFLVELLAAQVRRLSAQVLDALYLSAEVRTLRRLADLADLFGDRDGPGDGDGPCVVPLTQDDLASLAGTTRPTVNRVLKAAKDDGIVAMARGRIEVRDRAELARRAR
jgi:CRP-like cAMP-binding protein